MQAYEVYNRDWAQILGDTLLGSIEAETGQQAIDRLLQMRISDCIDSLVAIPLEEETR